MNRKINGLVKTAASISLAGGMLARAAGPAFAAAPNEAYGAKATGLINVGPLADATSSGTSPVSLLTLSIPGLLSTGVVTDTADDASASSTIANPVVTLSGLASLAATTVSSSCSFDTDTDTVSGTATLADANVALGGLSLVTLDANPTKNEAVLLPPLLSGIASITLNQQTTSGDGTLTVNAIAITLLGNGQTLTLGTSICNDATLAPVSILPGMATPIGLGTLGLLALGGTAYYVSRRRRVMVAA
jgi:hypothetical protein